MSQFVFFCCLFICKRKWVNYLGWGRESLFVCCCLPVTMWFLFGEVSSSSGGLGLGYVILLWHSLDLLHNYLVSKSISLNRS